MLRTFTFCLLIICAIACAAQQPAAFWLVERADSLVDQEQYEEANQLLIQFHQQTDSTQQTDRYYSSLVKLGDNYIELYEFTEAEKCFNRVIHRPQGAPVPHDSVLAIANGDLGYVYGKTSRYPEQLEQYLISLELNRGVFGEQSKQLGQAYNNLGTAYSKVGNYEMQLICYQKALPIRIKVLGADHARVGATLNNIGYCYGRMGDFDKELSYYYQALDIRKKALGEEHPVVGRTYNNIAVCLEGMERFEEARTFCLKGLAIAQNHYGDDHPRVAISYNTLGAIEGELGDWDKEIDYLNHSLTILEKYYGEISESAALGYNNLGSSYHKLGDYAKAEQFYQQSLEIRKKIYGENHRRISRVYGNLAILAADQDDIKKAVFWNKKAIDIYMEIFPASHPEILIAKTHLAADYSDLGEYEKARSLLFEVLAAYDTTSGSTFYRDKARRFLAQLYMRLGKCDSALIANDGSISIYTGVIQRANFLADCAKDKEGRIAANQVYAQAAKMLDERRLKVGTQSKSQLGKDASRLYDQWLMNTINLFTLTSDREHLEQAFEITLRSRAFTLREQIHKQRIGAFSGLPDSLLQHEKRLVAELNFYRNKIQQPDIDSLKQESWNRIIVKKQHDLDALFTQYKKQHPKYFNQKYSLKYPVIDDLKRDLKERNTSMLRFFKAGNDLLIFFINSDTLLVESLNFKDDVEQALARYTGVLQQADWQGDSKARFRDYCESAFQLYQKLVAPFEPFLQENGRILVIPDQQLGYIPFETLLVKLPENLEKPDYSKLDYWLRHQYVGYAYHSDFQKKRSTKKLKALVISPDFGAGKDSLRAALAGLRYGKEEREAIARHFLSSVHTGGDAVEASFKQHANEFSILHFTTHSLLNEERPEASCLLFDLNNDSLEDGALHNYELYNMSLNAEMAVLSACNTGVGKLQQGEGVMSLAHAFTYAGCPNVLMSLWQVNDHSTAILMEHFYAGLAEGKSKDQALRDAKLAYLEEADPLKASPYFWAGFVSIGDQSPLQGKSYAALLWLALALFLIGGIWVVWKKFK